MRPPFRRSVITTSCGTKFPHFTSLGAWLQLRTTLRNYSSAKRSNSSFGRGARAASSLFLFRDIDPVSVLFTSRVGCDSAAAAEAVVVVSPKDPELCLMMNGIDAIDGIFAMNIKNIKYFH